MTKHPISISIHITIHGEAISMNPAVEVVNHNARALTGAALPTRTFTVQPFLSNKDGGGGLPGTLPSAVQALWYHFVSCVSGKTVDSAEYKDSVNDQIGRLFHGPLHASGTDYMNGVVGNCVKEWLEANGYSYTFSKSNDPLTKRSRRNNDGTWDYNNPGVHYAVANDNGEVEVYMGIDTTDPI